MPTDLPVCLCRYFKTQAIEQYVECATYVEDNESPENIVPGFDAAFDCWEAPIYDPKRKAVVSYYNDMLFTKVTVPVPQGIIFLRKWLEPERKGTFPFIGLPPELRNTVYEMVFSFPRTEIYVQLEKKGHGLALRQRELDNLSKEYICSTHDAVNGLNSAPMQTILALLSVNKQIYAESMPYFYRVNLFNFDTFESLIRFTKNVPMERLQHLGHVFLRLRASNTVGRLRSGGYEISLSAFQDAAAAISQISSLKALGIEMTDSPWLEMAVANSRKPRGQYRKFVKPEYIPGMAELASAASKADFWEIQGDCPLIEAYLRSKVEQLKEDFVAVSATKQRSRDQRQALETSTNIDKLTNKGGGA